MNDENNNAPEGKGAQWPFRLWWMIGLSTLAAIVVWTNLSFRKDLSLGEFCLGVIGILSLAGLVIFVAVRYGKQIMTCWQQLKDLLQKPWLKVKKSWFLTDPWGVGTTVFVVSFTIWTLLCLFTSLSSSEYWQGLVLIGLAGPATGFTYWRGQQAETQIEKTQRQIEVARQQIAETQKQSRTAQRQADIAQRQIKESQRQARFQSFDSVIQMAVDYENPARAVAGWRRIHVWFAREQRELGRRENKKDQEDWGKFLEIARLTALSVLKLRSETKVEFKDELRKYEQVAYLPLSQDWDEVRRSCFKGTDDTRINEDVRQEALIFLIMHPPQQWVKDKKWYLSYCDLSDLSLDRDLLELHDPKGEWNFLAIGSHCIGMQRSLYVDLSEAKFSEAQMLGADLSTVNLSGAHFSNADLRYADLYNANLQRTLLYTPLLGDKEMRAPYELGFVRFYKTRIDRSVFTDVRGLPVRELKALLQGCWWSGGRESGYYADDYEFPLLPDGINPSKDIPGAPEDTKSTGGKSWKPSEDD